MRLVGIASFLLLVACCAACSSGMLIFQDNLDGNTSGESHGITYAAGKTGQAAVFDAPDDTIEYPADAFATGMGRIEFDMMLTQPLAADHPYWCMFSDVGTASAHRGAVVLQWHKANQVMEYGIFDSSSNWNWCYSTGINWQPGVWYSMALVYGSEGMWLEINGITTGSNTYTGGLSATPKKMGFVDGLVSAPPMMIDNFRCYKNLTYSLSVFGYTICPFKDGMFDTTTISYEVSDNSIVTIDVVNSIGVVAARLVDNESMPPGDRTLVWDGGGLPNGTYTIRMTARTPSETKQLQETVLIDNRWAWQKPAEQFRNYFPRGVWYFCESDSWYDHTHIDDPAVARAYYERTLQDLANHGVNLIMACWTPEDHKQMLLDIAQAKGMKVLIYLQDMFAAVYRSDPVNFFDLADSATRNIRNHPALAGYYIVDEPTDNPQLIERIKLAKMALEVVDPNHPGFSCLMGDYESLLNAVDYQVLLVDIYPMGMGWTGDFSGYIGQLERGQRNAGSRPLWVIPQVFGKPNVMKIPTPEEVRAEVWLALAHNTKGLIYFLYQSTTGVQGEWLQGMVDMDLNPVGGLLDEIGRLDADIAKLSTVLLSLQPAQFGLPSVPAQIVVKACTDPDGMQYAILANKDTSNTITLSWTGPGATDVLTGLNAGSLISLPPGGGKVLKLQLPGTVSGTVKSSSGVGLAGALVTSVPGGYSTVCGASGSYALSLPSGTYSLYASNPGYISSQVSVSVAADTSISRDITLSKISTGLKNGLDMTGMLVKVWGRLIFKAEDRSHLYVDNGSGPVRIELSGLKIPIDILPDIGAYVSVTGVVSKMRDGTSIEPVVRPRSAADIYVHSSAG